MTGSSAVSLGGHRPQANAAETRGRGKLVGDRRNLKTADYATKVTVAAVNGEGAQGGFTPCRRSTRCGAFAWASDSRGTALLIRHEPGAYPVQVSGAGDATGLALDEIYEMPD